MNKKTPIAEVRINRVADEVWCGWVDQCRDNGVDQFADEVSIDWLAVGCDLDRDWKSVADSLENGVAELCDLATAVGNASRRVVRAIEESRATVRNILAGEP